MKEAIRWGIAKGVLLSALVLGPFIYHTFHELGERVAGHEPVYYLDVR